MTHMLPPAQAPRRLPGDGFWRKTWAMLVKEFIQLRRDRVSFAMIIMIPLVQLMLFGYAINTTPRNLPTAVLLQESSDLSRSILAALENTKYFKVTQLPHTEAELDQLLASGKVLFAHRNSRPISSARCAAATSRRCWSSPTRPIRSPPVRRSARSARCCRPRSRMTATFRTAPAMPFEIRTHARYNPAGATQLNIVPGLVGTILTMTMLIFTALSVTREIERGTMENLLSMPITPVEIMLGKIIPYMIVGFVQAAMIIGIGVLLFGVPIYRQSVRARGVEHAVHRDQSVDRLHVLDHRAEPAAGDADVDDVLSAEHPAVRLHVSVRRHAGLGAMDRRGAAADALSAHRARDHAQGFESVAICATTRSRCSC